MAKRIITKYKAKCPRCQKEYYTTRVPLDKKSTFRVFCSPCLAIAKTSNDVAIYSAVSLTETLKSGHDVADITSPAGFLYEIELDNNKLKNEKVK